MEFHLLTVKGVLLLDFRQKTNNEAVVVLSVVY
jgi:hypothetical protein